MKYINSEKLKAEIERRRLSNRYIDTEEYEAELFDIIDSLQQEQPKVDLEKEVQAFLCNYDYEFDDDPVPFDIAKHFYELGLKTKKEE